MRNALLLGIAAAAAAVVAVPTTEARQGCGNGYHRVGNGRCVRNGPPVAVSLRIGTFYPGHGYWDGRRYWQHRYRHRNGWRYR